MADPELQGSRRCIVRIALIQGVRAHPAAGARERSRATSPDLTSSL